MNRHFDPPARALLAPWRDTLRDSALDSTAKLVGFVISTYFAGDGSGAFASRKTIAAGASLRSERAVYAAVRRLEAAGFLAVSVSKGRSSNRYAAVIPTVYPDSRLEPSTPEHGSEGNRASADAQPCIEEAPTVSPGARECVESGESDAREREKLTPQGRWWLDNIGAHYPEMHAFVADATKALKVTAAVAERLFLERAAA